MEHKYIIWDKQTNVITPIGEVLTAAQWIKRYPVAGIEGIKTVLAGGIINGAFFGVFNTMVDMYERQGCDFSECETDQDYLDKIAEFEDTPREEEISIEERTAAALELLALQGMEDVEEE